MSAATSPLEHLLAEASSREDAISQAIAWAEEIGGEPRYSRQELDEILTVHWPFIVRRVMADGSDEWAKGFVRSIAGHGKRAFWRPSAKQERIMRRLLSEAETGAYSTGEVIED